ncbi:hypothetical protein VPNG_04167 [Cytospora leucostoma]|uniref:Uncharacterized protein n=1 Tax=Cytospora leucostoma TaxID=1230097 RepID=A0A423XD30_9PEZI|nr:hypothetical protein VPNG_04167 [Cytospora leucostoma]
MADRGRTPKPLVYHHIRCGKDHEKEYHERLHSLLKDTNTPSTARLIPDLPTIHPDSGKPRQYLMLVDTTAIQEIAHLLQRTGDQCKVLFPGVEVQDQHSKAIPMPRNLE